MVSTQEDDVDSEQQQQQQQLSGLDDFEFCQPVDNKEEDSINNNAHDDPPSPPKKKKQKIECSIENCKNTAQSGGICIKHGGKYVGKRYYCTVEGCTKLAKRAGVCKGHGAKVPRPLCSIVGCTNLETNKGVCIRHGAKVKLCSVEECTKQAMRGGVCWTHGAKDTKVKRQCSVEDCTTLAVRGGVCLKHGAKRCSVEGCMNQARGDGVCCAHGAPPRKRKLCRMVGCPNQDKVKGYCKRHNKMVANARKEAIVVMEAPPGKLGITLKMDDVLGGATITVIDSDSILKDHVEVGDRVLSIDDHVITQTSDFGINKDKTRQFKIAVHNNLESVILREQTVLGEQLKASLSGKEISEMQSEIQRLKKAQEESLSREAALKIEVERAEMKETALALKLNDAKSRAKELREENVTLKTELAREKRRAKKCPNCVEKVMKKSPPEDDNLV
mmetsp:Transcript_7099/g.11858  ORF Transcript_7099/g.11858 Transcript_7099/m.11858 type:complete len:445 (-) Transcript_7099:40-1374(-)